MDLDQLAPEEDLDQHRVGPHVDVRADQVAWHRIQRLGHLDVVVAMDLGLGIERDVVGRGGRRQQPGGLLEGEQLGRPALGGAVDAHAGLDPAPLLGPALGVVAVDEALAGEE